MTLPARWNPMRDFAQLERRLWDALREPMRIDDELMSTSWVPAVDVLEDDDRVIVRAEVPGMKPEDIDIRFENGMLTITGERKLEKEKDGQTYHRVERSYGRFVRSFTLPASIHAEKASASYENGVLEIVMPKREEAKPRRIEISGGGSRTSVKTRAA